MKVLVVVARRFNGRQLWVSLQTFVGFGVAFSLVSTELIIQNEITKETYKVDFTLDDVASLNLDTYQGLMIVSGNPIDTHEYWCNTTAQGLVREFVKTEKPIAAICAAVPAIREACNGKRVSFYPLAESKTLLTKAGAIPSNVSVFVDGNIVTAENEAHTAQWAEYFCRVLMGEKIEINLIPIKTPLHKMWERKPIPEVQEMIERRRQLKEGG